MKEKRHKISAVLSGGIGEELELEPGDILLEINGKQVEDVFDYRYLLNDEYVVLLIEKPNGEQWSWRWRRNMTRIWVLNSKMV